MNNKDTSWNAVSDWYDSVVTGEGSYQKEVILPHLMRFVGDVKGMRILDVASGQGFFSHALAQAGARVTGVELSPELSKRAESKATKNETFLVGSAEKLPSQIQDASFDMALCVLALQNIKNLDAVLSEVSRVLVSGGRFLVVLNHPCFRIPKRSSWGFDESQNVQFRRLDGYLSESSEEITMHPGKPESPNTLSFHRPLQVYVKAFAKYEFLIDRLEEWNSHKESGAGPRKAAEDKARKEFPFFLFLSVRKISR